jgi:hypothetical protein
VLGRLKEALPDGPTINAYDLQVINRVYNIAADDKLAWKPEFSSRQYSHALVEWIVERVTKDADFLQDARDRFRQMNQATSSNVDKKL